MANFTTTAIITKGLHCGPACQGIITSHFSLICKDIPVPPVVPPITGGGPYPGPAWNIPNDPQTFYKPVEDQPFIVPRDQEAEYFKKYRIVEITVQLGDFKVEKEYMVPLRRAKIIVGVINLVNITREKIAIAVTGLKRIATNIVVSIKNLRLRK